MNTAIALKTVGAKGSVWSSGVLGCAGTGMGHGSDDTGCDICISFMLRGRNAGHEGPDELLARLGRDAWEASHGSQRCRAACHCLSPHPALRCSGFIPHFSGQPRAGDFPATSRDEPLSPQAAGRGGNPQTSSVWFLAILDTGSELPPLGGQGCNSPTLWGKAGKERNKRGGEAVRRGRSSRGFPEHQPVLPAQELPPGPSRP